MSETVDELKRVYEELQEFIAKCEAPTVKKALDALEEVANEIGKAWSQSWLGYQSRVYYKNLVPPPPRAHFSSEWGFQELFTTGTRGDWVEFQEDVVENEITRRAGNPDITAIEEAANKARAFVERKRDDVISILQTARRANDDPFLGKLLV